MSAALKMQAPAATAPAIVPEQTGLCRRISSSGDRVESEAHTKLSLSPRSTQDATLETANTGRHLAESYRAPGSEQCLLKGERPRDLTSHFPRISPMQGGGTPMIQRAIRFEPGSVQATQNAAENIVAEREAGITWPKLNGRRVLTADQIRPALNLPGIATTASTGILNPIQCWINYVRDNVGSYELHTLSAGPWTTMVPKAFMAQRFGVEPCQTGGGGNARLTAHGIPSDAAVAAHTTRHEQHHATDHEQVFNRILGPWDRVLTTNEQTSPRQPVTGADRSDCEARLYNRIGASPDIVSQRLADQIAAAGSAFHQSDGGNAVAFHSLHADAGCNQITAEVEPDRFRNIRWADSLRGL